MARPTLMIDLQRCVGCMSCIVACKMENDVPVGNNLTRVETIGPDGTFPDGLRMYFFAHGCMHCNKPACVAVCPTGASHTRDDGLVVIDPDLCIACGTCMKACPYGARSISPVLNVAIKCELCKQLIDNGGKPSCVKHCMATARFFGDLDDPDNDIAQYLAQAGNQDRKTYMLQDMGTDPTVAYLEPKCGMLPEDIAFGAWFNEASQ